MTGIVRGIRQAARALARSPGFSAAAILTLALGIGANTAVFSVLRSVLLRPLPYAGDQVVIAFEKDSSGNNRLASYPTFEDWRAGSDAFEGLAFIRGSGSLMRGPDGAERLTTAYTSNDFFRVLRESALLGRTLLPDDMRAGAPAVVVLSERLWQRRFGGASDVVGRSIVLDDRSATVVGVMPADFGYPTWADLWAPLSAITGESAAVLAQRGVHADSRVIGRLKAGVDTAAARRSLSLVAARLAAAYPAENGSWPQADVMPIATEVIGSVGPQLKLLTVAVALVLLIACVNVANLSLARGTARAREMAVRTALGAGRGGLARLLATEGVVLGAVGGALGLLAAVWMVDAIKVRAADLLPRMSEVTVSWPVAALTVFLSVVVLVLFGMLPALHAGGVDLAGSMKEGGAGSGTGRARARLRSTLVVAEFAVALMLVTGSGLLLRSLARLQRVEPGFQLEHLVAAPIFPPARRYATPDAALALYRRVAAAAAAVPGVRSVALTNHVPLSGASMSTRLEVDGVAPAADGSDQALFRVVDTAYFATAGIPVLRGRAFDRADMDHPGNAVLVNHTLAQRYWPGKDPVGRTLTVFKSAQGRPEFGEPVHATVVGVVGDVHHFGLDTPPVPEVYVPYTLTVWGWMSLVVRTTGETAPVIAGLTRAVLAVDRDIPLAGGGTDRGEGFRDVSDLLRQTLAPRRLVTALLAAFAVPALLLAALGIYGVIAYLVARRQREIGVRMALGADRRQLLGMVLRDGLRLAAIGVLLGLGGAVAATRLLASQLYGVGAADPVTLIAASAVLFAVALAASYLPARRAASLDPVRALRAE